MKKAVQSLWGQMHKRTPMKRNFSKQGRTVKLSIVDDITTVMSDAENAISEASYIVQDLMPELNDQVYEIRGQVDNIIVNSEANYLEEAGDEIEAALQKLEDSAGELGIDPNDIFDEYDDAKQMLQEMRSLQSEWDDLANEYPYVFRLTNL